MVFPLWSILIPYFLILIAFVIFSLVNLSNLIRFGFWNFASGLFVLVYLFISAALLLWTYQHLQGIDWQQPLYIFYSPSAGQYGL